MNNISRILLKPAALVYELVIRLRNCAYEHKLIKEYKAPIPVISIGNITLGGTGKTPVTINIAKALVKQGKRVAILSRGYRRESAGTVVVSDGTKLLSGVKQAGDEPYLIAQCVPGAVVIVAARRADAARIAVDTYNCNVILLDDGFQHRALYRDCDIVLADGGHELFKDCMFPAGSLREPLAGLRRAHMVVITNVPGFVENDDKQKVVGGNDSANGPDDASRLRDLSNMLSRVAPNAAQYQVRFVPSQLVRISGAPAADRVDLRPGRSLNDLRSKSVVAFCGIAKPYKFFDALSGLGLHVIVRQTYPDHYWYRAADVLEIKSRLENSGANLIVTTAKDAVRLQAISGASREILAGLPLWYLDIDVLWSADMSPVVVRYIEN